MSLLSDEFNLDRCPSCYVARPRLSQLWKTETGSHSGGNKRHWGVYVCRTCGGLVTAFARNERGLAEEWYPRGAAVDSAIPSPASDYLKQAIESSSAPDGALMLAAASVDAMLKAKGLTKGTLNDRIDEAAETHLITGDMAKWAHQVRLESNSSRHADVDRPLGTTEDAVRTITFAQALGTFMFVLPSMVTRGIADSTPPAST